jgi:hypothetical protein
MNHFTARTLLKMGLTLLARPAQYRVECRQLEDMVRSECFYYDIEFYYLKHQKKMKKSNASLPRAINKVVLALLITNTIQQRLVRIYFVYLPSIHLQPCRAPPETWEMLLNSYLFYLLDYAGSENPAMAGRRSSEVSSRRRFLSRSRNQERVVRGRGAAEGSSHHLPKPRSLRANKEKSIKSVKSSCSLIEPEAAKPLQSPDRHAPVLRRCRP